MKLAGMNIGFALTGSFCTLDKILTQIEALISEGAIIHPIISGAVDTLDTRFGKADAWKMRLTVLTGKKIITTIPDAEPIGPGNPYDLLIVAPCTGNTIAKLANGITDNAVTMACKAHLRNRKPLLISISTNDGLAANAKNIGMLLNTKNIFMVPFGQDDPISKTNSLVARCDLLIPAALDAMKGIQIQPLLV